MKKFFWFIVGLLGFIFLISFISTSLFLFKGDGSVDLRSANIGVIEIEGVISESMPVIEEIRRFKENDHLKALVVRLDTPGGAVGASQEIYLELKKLKEKTPVIISMGNLAASGGLYISLGASEVIALPGTITGSMGVLMPITNFSKLMDKIHVQPISIKSGALKDAGNPLLPLGKEARTYLQDMVDLTFQQFRNDVMQERKISEEIMKILSDGRVIDGATAKKWGIANSLGTFEDAIDRAKELGKISEKPKLAFLSRKPKSFVEELITSTTSKVMNQLTNYQMGPKYLWQVPAFESLEN